jgi:hypothetical protein
MRDRMICNIHHYVAGFIKTTNQSHPFIHVSCSFNRKRHVLNSTVETYGGIPEIIIELNVGPKP